MVDEKTGTIYVGVGQSTTPDLSGTVFLNPATTASGAFRNPPEIWPLVTGEHVRIIMRFDVRFAKRYDLDVVVKPSQLRANLYRLLDRVLRTGEPIEIDRAGKKLLLVPKEKRSRLNNLVRRDVIVGNPEDLVHLDWSKEWKGDLP